jgi:hypothetical protein
MTAIACMELEKGKEVYSTWHIKYKAKNGKQARFIDFSKLAVWLQTKKKLAPNSADLFIDEGYKGLDSRESQSIANKLMYRFILQARKLGLDVYVAAQLLSSVDKRVRRVIQIYIGCRAVMAPSNPHDLSSPAVEEYRYLVQDATDSKRSYEFKIGHAKAEEIYKCYNAWEIVKSPIAALDKKAAKEMLAQVDAGEAKAWGSEGGEDFE